MNNRTGKSKKKHYAVNPYLPAWEYVPDGEPRVFGNRLYIFGSHDRACGTAFCQEDYVAWSAPLDDPGDWTCHGVIYRKDQDPHNREDLKELWAPDVCRGSDGRYYLYYCRAFMPEIGIAVCDEPAGKYEFYDYVRDADGRIWDRDLPFDPGILYEDPEHIWLYTGFGAEPAPLPDVITLDMLRQMECFRDFDEAALKKVYEQAKALKSPSSHAFCLRLAPDMKTVLASTAVAPSKRCAAGTSFEEHPFFEASSPRRIRDTYYFIYSSFQGHELCYATSPYPDRGFTYRGVIISNADLGYKGNTVPLAYYANNHGGLAEINGQWYIFWHRHTNKTTFSRQGCAEPVDILPDGSIPQVEMTSCGLNGGPLPAGRSWSAHICCCLMGPEGACALADAGRLNDTVPYMAEECLPDGTKILCIRNLRGKAVCGVKYLEFSGENSVLLTLRGHGTVEIVFDHMDGDAAAVIRTDVSPADERCITSAGSTDCPDSSRTLWRTYHTQIPETSGVHAVYFRAAGNAEIDFSGFEFVKN